MYPMTNIILDAANEHGIDPRLILAICIVESGNRGNVARYESHYKWTFMPAEHAKRLGITEPTEYQLQKFSWGPMQIMGATARELGYNGFLPELCVPQVGILWGCIYLKKLLAKHGDVQDAVAAYNAGHPKKFGGKYINQVYVDKVNEAYSKSKGVLS